MTPSFAVGGLGAATPQQDVVRSAAEVVDQGATQQAKSRSKTMDL